MSKKRCEDIPVVDLSACRMPEINIPERRKLIKAYLKSFNKAIKIAIDDDELILKIQIQDEMRIPEFFYEKTSCFHQIDFIDNTPFKIK